MKKKMIAAVGLFCVVPLFAQSVNTTYYAPNGGYGGSVQSTRNGNTVNTTYYNANGLYGRTPAVFAAPAFLV